MSHDLFQWIGLVFAFMLEAVGYGKMKQKVDTLKDAQEKDAEVYLMQAAFQPFADEVLRRLERIESKQDVANGRTEQDREG